MILIHMNVGKKECPPGISLHRLTERCMPSNFKKHSQNYVAKVVV